MIGAIILGFLAGGLARLFTPGDPVSGCVPTFAVGIVGSLLGWWIFTDLLGIGDTDMLDLAGLPGAVIGSVLVLVLLRAIAGRDSG
ncbi:MAG: GlsB/YeaQ/YmgE family stress response membrane protein [Solirubrobacteraceae bacterium]|nr:GlsB/YeaQ/YmgE family stress response membrane protein [Solirubrobacteraceae bacterium]